MVRLGRSPYRLTRDTAYTVNVILIGVMQLKYSLLNPEYFIGKNQLVFTLIPEGWLALLDLVTSAESLKGLLSGKSLNVPLPLVERWRPLVLQVDGGGPSPSPYE